MSTHVSEPRDIQGVGYQDWNDPWSATWDNPLITTNPHSPGILYIYRDGTGRPWIEQYVRQEDGGYDLYYLTSDDFANPGGGGHPGEAPLPIQGYGDGYFDPDWFRHAHEGEEPVGRVESRVEESPSLEESTPLFGPQESPAPEPDYDPWDLPREGHWDPVGLRWVYDEPGTMRSAGILDDDHTHTLGESRLAADQESSAADHQADLGDEVAGPLRSGHWDPAALRFVYDEPTTMRSAGILGHDAHTGSRGESRPAADEDSSDGGHTDTREESSDHGHTGPRDESRPAADEDSSAADHEADLGGDEVAGPLRSGHWDPAALRWVPEESTSSVGKVLDDDTAPTTEESTQVPVEGSATQGVDPSVPFDPDTTPTSVEGTAAAPINVDSTSFEGGTARGFDPSVPLDQADPNLQSGIPDPSGQAALGDYSSAPTLNPNLLDPTAPGATLDHGLVERVEQDPQLVNALNQNEELANALEQDPTRIYQIEQELGLAAEDHRPMEPSSGGGATGLDSFTEPSPTGEPGTRASQDAHDQDFEGI